MASRSLGQLTIDLIAKIGGFTQGMTQAERVADKQSRAIQKKMAERAKEIDAAWSKMSLSLAVGMTGLSVAVGKTVSNASQIANLASVANATTTEFQKMAAGASTVGIEQDKLSDQLKDFTEKVGEFQATGGGGMKDFFETVAPKIGITAEAFRGLSGPQALQLYYDSLEKAGLSQQQMSFYLESMASDTTALIPLLANGGKTMKELGDAAAATGAVMDDKTIEAAQVLKLQMGLLTQQGEGLVTQMVSAMIPTLADVAGEFTTVGVEGSLAAGAGDVFATAFKTVAATAVGAYGAVRLLGKALGGMAAMADVSLLDDMTLVERLTPLGAYKGIKNLVTYGSKLEETARVGNEMFADLDAEALRLGETLNNIWGAGSGETATSDWASRIVEQRKALAALLSGGAGADIPHAGGSKSQAEKDQEAAEKFLQSMRDQVQKSQERTAWEQLHYDIQAKGLKLTDEQLAKAQGLATLMDLRTQASQKLSIDLDKQNTLYQLQERLMNAQQKHQLEMLTYGMGDQAAQELRERIALEQQQQAELRQMQHEHGQELRAAESADQKQRLQAMFDERYRLTQEAFAKELGLYDDAVKQKQAKERDWIAGAKAGMDTYVRDASNGYEATKQLAQNTFRSAEDAAVQFATTGKASASDLFSTIVQGLIRIQIQEAMTKMFGGSNGGVLGSLINTGLSWLTGGASATSGAGQYSLTSGGSGGLGLKLPGRATGGPVSAGGMYEVNERGVPELLTIGGKQMLMMAGQSGYVTPLAWKGGGAAGQAASRSSASPVVVNVLPPPGYSAKQTQRTGSDGEKIVDVIFREVESRLASQVAGGFGAMHQALGQRRNMGY